MTTQQKQPHIQVEADLGNSADSLQATAVDESQYTGELPPALVREFSRWADARCLTAKAALMIALQGAIESRPARQQALLDRARMVTGGEETHDRENPAADAAERLSSEARLAEIVLRFSSADWRAPTPEQRRRALALVDQARLVADLLGLDLDDKGLSP